MLTQADLELRRTARKSLSRHRHIEPADALGEMARSEYARLDTDFYGDGGAVARLEQRVSELLGKPAGLYFFKGVMAQLCVMRRHAEDRQTTWVAFHPLSHIDYDEDNAVEHLHLLRPLRLGRTVPFTVKELDQARERLACVIVELPLRRAGYLLPSWDELVAISGWCRQHGVPFHIDGARLWESAAGYGRSLEEIAALGDSVYVSFYKGLGGLAGCVVAGEQRFLDSLKPWKTRHGGNLFSGYPYAVSALMGLERYLPRMAEYVARARSLAPKVATIPVFQVYPQPPHVNAFAIAMPGWPDRLAEQHRTFARDTGVWLFNTFTEGPQPGTSIAEIVIGDTCEDFTDDEAAGWLRRFADRCQSAPV
ncbi:MAG TPA: beta-eliminating lyase-related protein [Dongiaceae bacterium]|jgi:threonine aldolase